MGISASQLAVTACSGEVSRYCSALVCASSRSPLTTHHYLAVLTFQLFQKPYLQVWASARKHSCERLMIQKFLEPAESKINHLSSVLFLLFSRKPAEGEMMCSTLGAPTGQTKSPCCLSGLQKAWRL